MSYTKTYICDFRRGIPRCRALAEGACALCSRHGCFDHLPRATRVVFELGGGVLPFPDLPLEGVDPVEGTQPSLSTFGDWKKLKGDVQHSVWMNTEAREFVERRICEECFKDLHGSFYRSAGGTAIIEQALAAFVQALRAGMAAHALRVDVRTSLKDQTQATEPPWPDESEA